MCDKCRNHGFYVKKKGHKDKCSYEHCPCTFCTVTTKRQKVMMGVQRVRRAKIVCTAVESPVSAIRYFDFVIDS